MRSAFFFTLFLFGCAFLAHAQEKKNSVDSTVTHRLDSTVVDPNAKVITIESYAKRFNPRKALLYSAVLPGAGQAYNKKYWKVPLVYGLIGGGVFFLDYNIYRYKFYKRELFSLLNEPAIPIVNSDGITPSGNLLVNGKLVSPSKLNVEQLRNAVNRWQRDRDFAVLMLGIIYFAQLIDAHVDAHLKEFDLNPQLKVAVEPGIQSTGLVGRTAGVSLKLTF